MGMHLTAYGGRDDRLFRAGIMESGNPIAYRYGDFPNPDYSSYDYESEQTRRHNISSPQVSICRIANSLMSRGFNFTDTHQPRYDLLVQQANCTQAVDTLQCLRGVPFDQLNAVINTTALGGPNWVPYIDGDFIQKYTSIQLAQGQFVKVPIIDGANTDEGTAFGPRGINTTEQFFNYLTGVLS